MKTDIHPKNYRLVVFQDTNNNATFLMRSCVDTTETIKYEGKEYPLFKTEISSASHPFYTGKKMTVDTAGRIEKFQAQRKKAEAEQEKVVQRGGKTRKRNTIEDKVNAELRKQLEKEQKEEEALRAKIKKRAGSGRSTAEPATASDAEIA